MFETIIAITTEQIAQLGEDVIISGASAGAILGFAGLLAKCITAGLNYKAKKNPIKLNEADKQAIGENVVEELKEGVVVDMSAQLDKATNQRLTLVEENLNALSEQVDVINDGVYQVAKAIGEFKTISADTRASLNEYVKTEPVKESKKIDVEKVVATIEKAVEIAKDVKDNLY